MDYKRISVFSHKDFNEKMYRLGIYPSNVEDETDKAFISITGTPDIMETYLKHDTNPIWFPDDKSNVLNISFDDVDDDVVDYKGYTFYGITEEQASKLFRFIDSNIGKHFYIMCRAGKSRSQGVCRYILDVYGHDYGYDEKESCRKENPCVTPNMRVVRMLKREYMKNKLRIIEGDLI